MSDAEFPLLQQLRGHVWHLAEHGKGPFLGATRLVERMRKRHPDQDPDEWVEHLLKAEQRKTLAAAAATAVLSTVALPAGLPASILAAALLDARMALSVAMCRGADIQNAEVRKRLEEAVHSVQSAARSAGTAAAAAGARATWQQLARAFVPKVAVQGRDFVVRQARKRWGRRLLPLARGLPLVGSVVLATIDAPNLRDIVARVDDALRDLENARTN